ncbi:biopolymer transporter ExbD [Seleniivibrio sp.]|uniref:ExbD/TolR family protein n=1 Tax=Seleniivibrio sp. TaxID=2898801 RepID=UPI0025E7B4C4|nr:biopolymer transporter ExbD [Seleniivibrio sp.]MCD8554737.1 biopolymer transporter ExbD [Seleniivibrio sp.]
MREKSFDSINVVPFIDIMLVLLTIVLATATFISTGAVKVKLPEAKKVENTEQSIKPVSIEITESGNYIYGGKDVTLDDFSKFIDNLDKKHIISVYADKKSEVQPLVDLMTLLKSKGFEQIDLKTAVKK